MFTVADPKPPVGDGKPRHRDAGGDGEAVQADRPIIDLTDGPAPAPRPDGERTAPGGAPVLIVPRTRREVRRVTAHVDTASVLKVSVLFFSCIAAVVLIAGAILWAGGSALGVVANVERLMSELGFRNFHFRLFPMLQAALFLSAGFIVATTALCVLASILYNLISDLAGGVQVVEIDMVSSDLVEADTTLSAATEVGRVVV